jgi:hypothetical protein
LLPRPPGQWIVNIIPAKDHAEAFLMVKTDRAVGLLDVAI